MSSVVNAEPVKVETKVQTQQEREAIIKTLEAQREAGKFGKGKTFRVTSETETGRLVSRRVSLEELKKIVEAGKERPTVEERLITGERVIRRPTPEGEEITIIGGPGFVERKRAQLGITAPTPIKEVSPAEAFKKRTGLTVPEAQEKIREEVVGRFTRLQDPKVLLQELAKGTVKRVVIPFGMGLEAGVKPEIVLTGVVAGAGFAVTQKAADILLAIPALPAKAVGLTVKVGTILLAAGGIIAIEKAIREATVEQQAFIIGQLIPPLVTARVTAQAISTILPPTRFRTERERKEFGKARVEFKRELIKTKGGGVLEILTPTGVSDEEAGALAVVIPARGSRAIADISEAGAGVGGAFPGGFGKEAKIPSPFGTFEVPRGRPGAQVAEVFLTRPPGLEGERIFLGIEQADVPLTLIETKLVPEFGQVKFILPIIFEPGKLQELQQVVAGQRIGVKVGEQVGEVVIQRLKQVGERVTKIEAARVGVLQKVAGVVGVQIAELQQVAQQQAVKQQVGVLATTRVVSRQRLIPPFFLRKKKKKPTEIITRPMRPRRRRRVRRPTFPRTFIAIPSTAIAFRRFVRQQPINIPPQTRRIRRAFVEETRRRGALARFDPSRILVPKRKKRKKKRKGRR